jgi:hypothetical protein
LPATRKRQWLVELSDREQSGAQKNISLGIHQ